MLYLLDKDVRTVCWNGEPLHEATSAIVKEAMNGDFILTVKYPISDTGIYQQIKEDMLIKCPTPVLGPQLFRIKKPVENNDHLEITAYHITDDIMQRSVKPVQVTNQTCSIALSQMVQNAKTDLGNFSFTSDIQDHKTFNMTETENIYSVLLDGKHSIVGTWEGELVRDNFSLTVKKNRGENRGVVITTHKNLKSYQRSKNSQNVITRIHAKSAFKPEGSEHETTIKVTVDSPLINFYPYINEKEYENNNAKSVEELKKWAQAKFTNSGIDKVSDTIKIEAYELDGQVVHLGDTVNIKSSKHNADIYKKAIAYEYDALKEEYISLEFDDKAGIGGSGISNGLSDVTNAILGATYSAQEFAIERATRNADLAFEHQSNQLKKEVEDGIELIKTKSEEDKQKLSDEINRRFQEFSPAGFDETKAKAEEALQKAGASYNLAEEAKYIASVNDIALGGLADNFNKQSGKLDSAIATQTALSGDLDTLKKTVASEVNQASEHRRTTTDALSRMTGQMSGFATKSEVRQDVTGLTETFAKLKTDTNNLISGAKSEITLAKTEFQKTADGLSAKMSAVESYVAQDGQRQEALRRYTREESAKQATAVRELVTRDFVGKSAYQEDVKGLERRFSAISTQTNNDIASKIAQYKQTVDGQFASIASQISGKVNQTDFQRVRETSQLYERILGSTENGIADKVARMALTNQLFQVEISKYATQGGPNLIKNSGNPQDNKNWGYWEFGQNPAVRVGTHDYFFKNKRNLFYVVNKTRETVPVSTSRFSIKRNTVYSVALTIFNTWNMTGATIYFLGRKAGENQTFTTSVTLADNIKFSSNEAVRKNYTFNSRECDEGFIRIDNNGTTDSDTAMLLFGDVDVYEGTTIRPWQPSPEDANEAVRTVQTQLAGSWAVQNLNSAGDLISGINLGANGHNRFVGKLTHITGETLIDNAVIKSAMIDKLKTANFEAGSVTTNILGAEAVTAEKVKFDTAFIQRLVSQQAFINELFAKQATITKIQSIDFTGNHIKGGKISSLNGVTDFDLQTGWIDMNKEAVGIRNRFDGKPMQFLIFGQGSINGVPSAYTQLMSNRNGQTGIEHTSAGIQIWNGRLGDNIQTAITFYGKSMDFMPNSQGGGVSLNTETRDFKGLNNITATGNISTSGMITANNIFLSGYGNNNLKALFNDIYKNLALLHKNKETKNNYTYSMYGPID